MTEEKLLFPGAYAYGIVENIINDPKGKINRVQVRFFGIHTQDKSKLPTSALPWCQILLPVTANDGSSSALRNGMCVKCSFLDGIEMQKPVVEGILPGFLANGTTSVLGNTDYTLSDYADNRNITKKTQINSLQPADPYAAQYPYNLVYQSPAGHRIEYDDTVGAERIHIYHKSGTNYEAFPNGDYCQATVGTAYSITKGGYTQYVGKDLKVQIDGNINSTVTGNANYKVGGNFSLEVDGNTTLTLKGNVTAQISGTVTADGSGNITVNGAAITLIATGAMTLQGTPLALN